MSKTLTERARAKKLKALCTDRFLHKLSEVARLYGWSGDYVEVEEFVRTLHSIKGVRAPIDLEPYTLI